MSLLQRLHSVLSRPASHRAVAEIYRICVEQARQPVFYQRYGVPDTLDGRFDLLLLHILIVMQRLSSEPQFKQQLFDLMFSDMDRSLREMGVGDMSLGKKIRPMISAFYGRGQAYQKALAESDAVLATTLSRNLYGGLQVAPDILQQMATYVRLTVTALEQQSVTDIIAGKMEFVLASFS